MGQLLLRARSRLRRGLVDDAISRSAREPTSTKSPSRPTARCSGGVDGDLETRTEIVVSPEDDVELRRVSVTNHGRETRSLDLTSYAEVVLAPADADLAHPAFSNLFVETVGACPSAMR